MKGPLAMRARRRTFLFATAVTGAAVLFLAFAFSRRWSVDWTSKSRLTDVGLLTGCVSIGWTRWTGPTDPLGVPPNSTQVETWHVIEVPGLVWWPSYLSWIEEYPSGSFTTTR